jgi:hypothetical protein
VSLRHPMMRGYVSVARILGDVAGTDDALRPERRAKERVARGWGNWENASRGTPEIVYSRYASPRVSSITL